MKLSNKLRACADLIDAEIKNDKCIKVWYREDCPEEIMNCFINHDDIDHIAFVPDEILKREGYIGFLDTQSFGCCMIEEHEIIGGKLYVGYHS